MQAVVGQAAPFDHGRQQLKLLANLEITTKAVERTAEAIGENIATHEKVEIQRAMQLDLPIVIGKPVPILYVQMDGTGVPVVKKETLGGLIPPTTFTAGQSHAPENFCYAPMAFDKRGFYAPQGTTFHCI